MRVDVDAAPGVALASLALDVTLGTGGQKHETLPASGGRPSLPGSALLLLPDVATQVTVVLTGVDGRGATLTASKTIESVPHQEIEVMIVLGAPAGDGGVDGGTDLAGVDLFGVDFAQTQLTVLAGEFGGNGEADGTLDACRLNGPSGVALSGNTLYILESNSGGLRTLDVTTNTVTTLALSDPVSGNPFSSGGGQGMVYDSSANALYFASSWEHVVRKIDVATGHVTVLAGNPGSPGSADATGNMASFRDPTGVALDGLGNLYVADSGNALVR